MDQQGRQQPEGHGNPESAVNEHARYETPANRTDQHHNQHQEDAPSKRFSAECIPRARGGWRKWKLETWFAGVIAFATIAYTVVAVRQLINLQRQFITSERAWVTVRDLKLATISGRPATVQIIYHNSGKTPARQLVINAKIFAHYGQPETIPVCPIFPQIEGSVGVLGPGADGNMPSRIPALDDTVFDAMKNGKAILVVCGRMEYLDIFDSSHQTSFCHFYRATTNQTFFCPTRHGNDAT